MAMEIINNETVDFIVSLPKISLSIYLFVRKRFSCYSLLPFF